MSVALAWATRAESRSSTLPSGIDSSRYDAPAGFRVGGRVVLWRSDVKRDRAGVDVK